MEGAKKAASRGAEKAAATAKPAVVHNLNGQRLGRKGRDTRQRIITATEELLSEGPLEQVTLSAVARKVPLGMSSLYLYFTDLTELLVAVLEPVMATAEDSFLARLRERWPDDGLYDHCLDFLKVYHAFWVRNSPILHLRNHMADRKDLRMMHERVRAAQPVMRLFVHQMDHDPDVASTPAMAMASVLYTGIERVVTIATDHELQATLDAVRMPPVDRWLLSEARLLELGIRDYREAAKAPS
jgi:AcrR family transcriptional regulator